METTDPSREDAAQLSSVHPAVTLVTVLALGIAALVAPAWLAHANPTGVEMVDGIAVHAADAPGAKLRGYGHVGGMLAAPGVKPGSDRTRQFVVGLLFFCVEDGTRAELTGIRAVPRPGTPEIPASGVVRRLQAAQPGRGTLVMMSSWGDPAKALDDVGTWHDLPAEVTGPCTGSRIDAFVDGGEEVMALLEVGEAGIDVERFELDAMVNGKPHRLLVDATVGVCGTEVRAVEDVTCDD